MISSILTPEHSLNPCEIFIDLIFYPSHPSGPNQMCYCWPSQLEARVTLAVRQYSRASYSTLRCTMIPLSKIAQWKVKSFCPPRENPSVPYFVLIRMEKSTLTHITSISKACSNFIPFILHLFLQDFLVRRAAVAFPTFIPSRRKLIVMEMTASVRPAESAFCRKLTRSAHDDSELNLSDPTVVWGHVFPAC